MQRWQAITALSFIALTGTTTRGADRIPPGLMDVFAAGQAQFEAAETPATGLGPVFNATSCAGCHKEPSTGRSSATFVTRFGRIGPGGFDPMPEHGGPVIEENGIATGSCVVPGKMRSTRAAGRSRPIRCSPPRWVSTATSGSSTSTTPPRSATARAPSPFWDLVRDAWRDIIATHERFTLRAAPDQGQLFTPLFEYADRLYDGAPFDPVAARAFVRQTVRGYLAKGPGTSGASY